ncbi:MAG TPA: sialidase family protein [Terriglobales bacterium]|nr:sialidase family protein [Terriglobales bacterium]
MPQLLYDSSGVAHAIVTLFNLDDGPNVTYETHSADGVSWSPLVVAVPCLEAFAELDSAAADNNPASPFANTLYASTTQYLNNLGVEVTVSRSTDGGATWQLAVAANLPSTTGLFSEGFSHLAIGSDGTVYLSAMATPAGSLAPNKMIFTKSLDGGKTWSPVARVFTATAITKIPNTPISAGDAPFIAVDNSGGSFAGRLYMTFYNWTGSFMQVLVTNSSDGGQTWSTPVPVAAATTHDQFLPAISVSSSGMVAVSWLDRRDDPGNTKYRAYVAFSNGGGATFSRSISLASALSQPVFGIGVAFNTWLDSTLYALWPDTRNGGGLAVALGGYAF